MTSDPALITIRPASPDDVAAWCALRTALWPELGAHDAAARDECVSMLRDPASAAFVAARPDAVVGFVELRLRDYADGCDTSPVGYVEGWYVAPEFRGRGVGRRLVAAGEDWARSHGCSEMASDTLIDNVASQRAHERLGYAEVERAVRYRKELR